MNTFTVIGSSMLLATSHAHISMTEPKWNFGTADTSKCDEIYKEYAAASEREREGGTKLTSGNPISQKALQKKALQCDWMETRQSFWFNTGTQIGCPKPTGQACGLDGVEGHSGPCCENPMKPTLTSPELLSFKSDVGSTGNNTFNPWFAPGFAPVLDPCGIVGGYKWDNPALYFGGPEKFGSNVPCNSDPAKGPICPINGMSAPEDMQFKAGTFGSELFHNALTKPRAGEEQPVTQWTAGGVAEVGQGALWANHGGGYQWRLCSVAEFTADGIKNEECFQRSPLEYATSKSAIQFGVNHRMMNKTGGSRVEFDAVRVTGANTDGVMPKGSTWTKFPVPNCGPEQEFNSLLQRCKQPTHLHGKPLALNFPEPAEGAYGYGSVFLNQLNNTDSETILEAQREITDHYDFTVVDTVKVPEKEGRYVLSWRWDAEQTPQVWNNCALVDIVHSKNTRKRSLRGTAHRI